MSLVYAGGWVMLPLLLISVAVLSIIVDRSLVYMWNPMPSEEDKKEIIRSIERGDFAAVQKTLKANKWLNDLADTIGQIERKGVLYEERVTESIEEIRSFLEARLSLLATLAKISPLLGLLGTVIGMIRTFSVVAQSSSGINMEVLAEGIWQALITTATGLIIAILALLFYKWFQGIEEKRLSYFNRLGSTACLQQKLKTEGKND